MKGKALRPLNLLSFVILLSPLLLQVGCVHIEPDTIPEDSTMKEGPGLFSGEKGYFEL